MELTRQEIDARLARNRERVEVLEREVIETRAVLQQLEAEVDVLERDRAENNLGGVLYLLFDPVELAFMARYFVKCVRRYLEGNA